MKPIRFPEVNLVIAKDQPQYIPLSVHKIPDDHAGRIVFCWRLSWPERLVLLLTGKLWHTIMTFDQPLQPQRLNVTKPKI